METVSYLDIYEGLKRLGVINQKIIVHSSLSSFGHVDGGAETVANVLVDNSETVMMPAFCWDSNTKPIKGDRPEKNGCDYSFYDGWNKFLKPFIVESAGIEKSMGIISKTFIAFPGVVRSDHAWHSWAAYGDMAGKMIANHSWEVTNLPLERMAEAGGWLLLLGVGLEACSAIHVAEERAGRQPFIRWAVDKNGKVRRVRASGCAKGFNSLMDHCKDLFKETYVGNARLLATPLNPFIEHITNIIIRFPELTRCSENCIRCRDSVLGGPAEN